MHHPNGCSSTPAYKDGIVYATLGDTLYAFDAHLKGGDDGVQDAPKGGERYDIIWSAKVAGKRCQSSPSFAGDELVINTPEGLEFWPTRVKDPAKVQRSRLIATGGSDFGCFAHDGEIVVAATRKGHSAFELKTGKELWTAGTGEGTTPAIDGETVYFVDSAGTLHSVDRKSGELRWKQPGYSQSPASPAVSKGAVYMASLKPGSMNALDPGTGERIWTWAVPDRTKAVSSEDYADAVLATPLVADGRVLFTSYTGYLYCLRADKDAKERLVFKEKLSDQVCMTVPMVHEGAVYVRGWNATFKFGGR